MDQVNNVTGFTHTPTELQLYPLSFSAHCYRFTAHNFTVLVQFQSSCQSGVQAQRHLLFSRNKTQIKLEISWWGMWNIEHVNSHIIVNSKYSQWILFYIIWQKGLCFSEPAGYKIRQLSVTVFATTVEILITVGVRELWCDSLCNKTQSKPTRHNPKWTWIMDTNKCQLSSVSQQSLVHVKESTAKYNLD